MPLRTQEQGQLPRDVHARLGFDPDQPQVPAGIPMAAAWEAPTPPIPPSLPSTFTPAPLEYLDSAKYWGAGPTSSGVGEVLRPKAGSEILGQLEEPNDAWDVRTSGWLGSALFPNRDGGILGNSGQSSDSWDRSNASWLRSAMPPSPNGGIFGVAPLPAFLHARSPGNGNTSSFWLYLSARMADHVACPRCKAKVHPTLCIGGRLQPDGPSEVEFNLPEWIVHSRGFGRRRSHT